MKSQRKLTKEQEKEVCLDYSTNLLSVSNISKKFGTSKSCIWDTLKREGVTLTEENRRKNRKKYFTDKQEKIIEKLYIDGKLTVSKINEQMNCVYGIKSSKTKISSVLKNRNISRRKSSDYDNRKLLSDDIYFSGELTEEKAYWIGFLMADGCIYKNVIEVGLEFDDFEHIIKFRRCLKIESRPQFFVSLDDTTGKYRRTCKISFTNKKMIEDLNSYGVVSRKSTKEIALNGIEKNRHFWRGVIDGDGSITFGLLKSGTRPFPKIKLSGSKFLCKQFLDFIKNNIVGTSNTVKKVSGKNCFVISFQYKKAYNIIKYLYCDSSVFLSRKMETARKVMDIQNENF